MKKYIILFLVLLTLVACKSKIDEMIPPAQLVGAVQNVDVTISGSIKKCTEDSNSSFWIKATGIVPFDIKREQVKPTLLAVFKATKAQYPHCEKIFVELIPSREMAETGNLAGRGEYEKKLLKLNYGIPLNQLPPTKKAFDTGKKIIYLMTDPMLMKYDLEQRLKITSKKVGLSEKETRHYYKLINNYYGLLGSGSEEERIYLK